MLGVGVVSSSRSGGGGGHSAIVQFVHMGVVSFPLMIHSLGRERELHKDAVSADYLKKVVYGYMICTAPNERLPLLNVIATMLHFTPEEIQRARSLNDKGGGVTGWLSSKLTG